MLKSCLLLVFRNYTIAAVAKEVGFTNTEPFTKAFTKKTGLNDRLINYTMSFEKSFALVNNIR